MTSADTFCQHWCAHIGTPPELFRACAEAASSMSDLDFSAQLKALIDEEDPKVLPGWDVFESFYDPSVDPPWMSIRNRLTLYGIATYRMANQATP
jgi:hypothetical protein